VSTPWDDDDNNNEMNLKLTFKNTGISNHCKCSPKRHINIFLWQNQWQQTCKIKLHTRFNQR